MSGKMRESFELWWRSLGHQGFRKKPDGRYGFDHTETAWQAWQASRAALVVELPDSTGCGPAYHEAICDVTCSLDDAGVSYK